ncbi:MAG: DUF2079 domain-containing protein [Candidatus Shapirobacteria bacterium]|nr:DUF2079 domain-containing protein [Candidatus Shapirobacteria bacterium]
MKKKYYLYLISLGLCLVFFIAYFTQSIELYNAHRTRGDLTNFAQAMWNTVHGRPMQNTFNYSIHNFWGDRNMEIPTNSNVFGIHFNPIIFLFVPFYYIFPVPQTLLIIQSLLTALGGFIVFLLAKDKLKNFYIAIIIQTLFLTYFTSVSAVLSEFHAFSLSIFFGLLLIYANEKLNQKFYYISLALFLLVQENVAITAFFFGLYLILTSKNKRRGITTALISLVYFFLTIKVFIPQLSNYHTYIFESIYGNPLGSSIFNIIVNSIKNPVLFFKSVFTSQNISYLSKLFFPIFPFFFFAPLITLVGLSALSANLLSTDLLLKSTTMHYESLSIPFFIYAVILGINNFSKISKKIFNINYNFIILFIVVIFMYTGYKKFTSPKLNFHLLLQSFYTPLDREMDDMIKLIPENSPVSTQDYISGHLTNRQNLYIFPVYYDKVKYLLLGKDNNYWPLTEKEQFGYIHQFKNNKEYRILKETSNFILFSKN